MNRALLRVLRTVIRTDSDPARQALFTAMLRDRPAARLAFSLHARIAGSFTAAALVSLYGAAAVALTAPAENRRARLLAFAAHANARRQVGVVSSWVGAEQCGLVRAGRSAIRPASVLALAAAVTSGRLAQFLRILRRVDRRYGFLVACRVAGAVGWYARSHAILNAHRPAAVLVSSDAQPEEMAFVAAARANGIPQVFASHAYPTPLSPPLDFTLSILEGEAEAEARRQAGPIGGEVVLAGIPGDSAPMDARRFGRANPVIGIFTPKAVAWPALAALIEECQTRLHARKVVLRWHPSMVERPHLPEAILHQVVMSPAEAILPEVAGQCDWVVADENSHVHLPVLKLGIPTIAMRLGVYPESRRDQYGLIANSIVYPRVRSLAEIEPERLLVFYTDRWAGRFQRYDAAYLRPEGAVREEVRRAVVALFDPAASVRIH